ncbi:acylpyruvate hydrolase [Fistulifera solaris]|uniref:Acylpyruvate hydrolase n=1 Tax=Fistulifera solaris TaxID=1519565 RepID=A0A1Z5JRS5_FISSO|nr:acylpyruvate hydrolase [Fistulifera solaris]|eukprot:GAX16714.1 acylpyruvate hydrolase [Fistulifera solaris]
MNCSIVCNAIGCRTRAKYRCSDCQKVWYCSQVCQEKDWKLHHKDLCPIYKISDDEGPAGLLMLTEMLFGKVPWHCIFSDEARLRRFAKGSLDMGIIVEDSDGRPLTMDIYDNELSPEERHAAMVGLVMSRMTDLLPDSSLIEQMLGKIPLNCHQCRYRGPNQNLRPDANLGGTRFLCLPCDSKNEVLYDFNCLNWNQVAPEDPEKTNNHAASTAERAPRTTAILLKSHAFSLTRCNKMAARIQLIKNLTRFPLCQTFPRIRRQIMTTAYTHPVPEVTAIPIVDQPSLYFPIRRIYCVGRNFAEHAREMGSDPDRDPPFFFSKPRDAAVHCPVQIPYPLATHNLHYEIELVVAIGQSAQCINIRDAPSCVYGLAVGVDLTRRDLQAMAKEKSRPWDCSKGFDWSAPMSSVQPLDQCSVELKKIVQGNTANKDTSIWLDVNGERKQFGKLSDMTWSIPEIISILSQQIRLEPGDVIFTGTPSGVGPLQIGDVIEGGVDGLTSRIQVSIIEASS